MGLDGLGVSPLSIGVVGHLLGGTEMNEQEENQKLLWLLERIAIAIEKVAEELIVIGEKQ